MAEQILIPNTKNPILFYGPLWFGNKKRIGGSETGNKRTFEILTKLGFKLKLINKPYLRGNWLTSMTYPIRLLCNLLKFIWILSSSTIHSFHLTGYYFYLIYIEYIFIATSRIFRVRSIYEIRAGGVEVAYKNGSTLYKFFFRQIIMTADVILCQGKESLKFVKEITSITPLYYPNFVMNDNFLPYEVNNRDRAEKINLIYFGRIVPSKNVEFIIDICLCLKRSHFPFILKICGSTNGDKKYFQKILLLIDKHKLNDEIIFTGVLNVENLFPLLLETHFFVFPTIELREGHSNSLTEAMSCGVVPIASPIGFNKSIVENEDLVVEDFEPLLYAEKIVRIWTTNKWHIYSKKSYNRIASVFTEDTVTPILVQAHLGIPNKQ